MLSKADKLKILELIDEEYESIKKVASLIAVCPHVVPAGIGIAQYLDDLQKEALSLQKYLYAKAKEQLSSVEMI